jgi:porin
VDKRILALAIGLAGASVLMTSRANAAQASVDALSDVQHGHGAPSQHRQQPSTGAPTTSEALGGTLTLDEALVENRKPKSESSITQMEDELTSFPETNPYALIGYDQKQWLLSEESTKQQQDEKKEEDFERLVELGALLNLFNHTEFAYGAPSSIPSGPLGSRTHLLGDGLGLRKTWAEKGLFVDFWTTTFYQGVSGAVGPTGGWLQTATVDLTLSTEMAGLWPGGFFHVGVDSKFGNSANPAAGSFSPVNYAATFPVVQEGNYILPTEYYLFQTLGTDKLVAIFGKATGINFADLSIFAGNKDTQFMNVSLNNNLMLGAFIPWVSTWYGGLVWQVTPDFQSVSVAIDPNGSAENFADNFFKDIVIAQQFTFKWGGDSLPGSLVLGGLWSSKDSTDFSDPVSFTTDGELNFQTSINTTSSASMAWLTFDQYFTRLEPSEYEKEPFFYNPRGAGLFGRFGIGPENSNLVSWTASLGFGAKGVIPGRLYDEFGLGWYYLNFSQGTIDSLQRISRLRSLLDDAGEPRNIGDEQGIEFYYNFALTPSTRLSFDLQYIFNPALSAQDRDGVLVLGSRLNITY